MSSYLRKGPREIARQGQAYAAYAVSLSPILERMPFRPGDRVLEVGCGAGAFTRDLATRYPETEFVGWDLDRDFIASAQRTARRAGLDNVTHEAVSGRQKPRPLFSHVVCRDFLLMQTEPAIGIRQLARWCRKGGSLVALEFDYGLSALVPNVPDHDELAQAYNSWARRAGPEDYTMGRQLFTHFTRAGLRVFELLPVLCAFRGGTKEIQGPLRAEIASFRVDKPRLIKEAGVSGAQIDRYVRALRAHARNPESLVLLSAFGVMGTVE